MNPSRRTFFTNALVAGAIQLAITVVIAYKLYSTTIEQFDPFHRATLLETIWTSLAEICALPLAPLLHLFDFWTLFIGPSNWLILFSNSAIWGLCIAAFITLIRQEKPPSWLQRSIHQQKRPPSRLRRFVANPSVLVSIFSIGFVLLCTAFAIACIQANAKNKAVEMSLVGTWTGQESWGTRWTITRRANRTFSETIDFKEAAIPHHPEIVKSEGRFFIRGAAYGYVYTKSTNPEFLKYPESAFDIESLTDTKLIYRVCEGNWADETKKPPAP